MKSVIKISKQYMSKITMLMAKDKKTAILLYHFFYEMDDDNSYDLEKGIPEGLKQKDVDNSLVKLQKDGYITVSGKVCTVNKDVAVVAYIQEAQDFEPLKARNELSTMAIQYLDFISKMHRLTDIESQMLKEVVPLIRLDQNVLNMPKYYREKIATKLGIADTTARKAMSGLSKKGILIKKDIIRYEIQADILGTKCWDDVRELKVVIEYDENGRSFKLEEVE